MSVRSGILGPILASFGAVGGFVVGLGEQDRVSEPVYTNVRAEFGIQVVVLPEPFSLGSCVPGTTTLGEEPYLSGDEILGQPIYRCTGWTRPLRSAAVGAAAATGLIALLIAAERLLGRARH